MAILALFSAFGLGAGGAQLLVKRAPKTWIVFALLALALAAYWTAMTRLPMRGLATEAAIVGLAALVTYSPMYLMIRDRTNRVVGLVSAPLMMLVFVTTMIPLFSRILTATQYARESDGVVLNRIPPSHPKQFPVIEIATNDGGFSREDVPWHFFNRVSIGQAIHKPTACAFARVDGQWMRFAPDSQWEDPFFATNSP